MIEVTDLLTCTSCRLQSTKKFPWEFPDIIKDLLIKLNYTKECFNQGKVPDIKHTSYSESDHKEDMKYRPNGMNKQPWSVMKTELPSTEKGTFQGIPVLSFQNGYHCLRKFSNSHHSETDIRRNSFSDLLSTFVRPFPEAEETVTKFQYNILLDRMNKVIEEDGDSSPPSLKSLMYRLCTTPKLYLDIPLAVYAMLYCVCVATSECGIESLIITLHI